MKNTFNDLIFMIRFIFNDKKIIFQLLFMSLIPVLIPILLIPLNTSFTMLIQFSIIGCVAIVFGITTYNYRYSTLYENNRLTSNSSWTFYISKYIFIVILSVIIAILLIGVLAFLNLFDLLMRDLLGMSGGGGLFNRTFYDFSYLPWSAYFIATIELATVTFAISFLIKSLSKSSKIYYMFILCLLLLIIPFGSLINIYFDPIYTNYDSGFQWQGDSTAESVFIKEKAGMAFYSEEASLMARALFIPSLIFPFYSTGVLFSTIGSHMFLVVEPSSVGEAHGIYGFVHHLGYSDVFQWYSISDINDGVLQHAIDRNDIDSSNFMWQYKLVELMPLIDVIIFGSIGSIISKLKTSH